MTLLTRRLFVVLAMLLAALASPAAANENVTRVNTSVLPPLAAGSSVPTLLVLDGRPVVVQGRTAAVRSGGAQAWTPINPGALSNLALRDVAGDGMRAVVTSTDGRLFLASRAERGIDVRPLGTLPQGVGAAKAALIEDEVVVIAQSPDGRSNLLRLPLSGEAQAWTRIAAPGGTPVALAGQSSILFVVVDRGGAQQVYSWTAKTGWKARTAAPQPLTGVVRSIGQAGLLFVAQVQGGRTLLTYNTITDAWSRVTTAIANEAVVAPFGDGVLTVERRGDQLVTTNNQLEYQRRALGWIDWTIISVYLVGMLGIGFYFWKRSRGGSTNEFFLGSRQIPFWAAGVSMFATNTSSISYLAVPAKAFDTDWQYMMSKVVTVFALIAVAILIIPMFRRLNLVSVFGYLETRFHPAIRMLSSALAILMHVGGRMGIVLFLPALAIGTITGTNVIFCILVIGVCTIVYTALGGMKAVVWTDFFQVVVLFGGAIFAIGFIVHTVGFGQIYDTAMQFDKTKMVNVSFDFTTPTLWGFIILYTFDTVLTFPKDQVLMQRVLSTSDEKEASRSVWLFALILMPAGFIFYIIGTTLFAYYRANPERLDPLLSIDAVFPAFIGTELPHGVTGIIIAGLFAAAMGTLSGTINSVATLLSVDFYEKMRRTPPTQKQAVRFAEWMTVVIGAIGIALAVILSRLDVRSLLDLTIELFGLLGGSCAGAYTLGMFTKRANWQGTAIGIISATVVTLVCWVFSLVHPYFYLAIAIVASIAIGYVASLFFPAPTREQLDGLTIYDRHRDKSPPIEVERLA